MNFSPQNCFKRVLYLVQLLQAPDPQVLPLLMPSSKACRKFAPITCRHVRLRQSLPKSAWWASDGPGLGFSKGPQVWATTWRNTYAVLDFSTLNMLTKMDQSSFGFSCQTECPKWILYLGNKKYHTLDGIFTSCSFFLSFPTVFLSVCQKLSKCFLAGIKWIRNDECF